MSTSIANLSPQQLRQAADLKDKIAALEKELGQILSPATGAVTVAAPRRKYKVSGATKAKMAAAAKARWAKSNKPKVAVKSAARKAKRKMSAAGRAKISAAAKARWAKAKAEGKKKL